MKLQEAKNLSIGDIVFVIDKRNVVREREVIGTKLVDESSVNITYVMPGVVNDSGFVLSHGDVFLKEEYALEIVLDKYVFQRNEMESKIVDIRNKITKLTKGAK